MCIRDRLKGTLIGAAIFGLISTAIGMIDTPPYVIYWIQGGIIVVAVYLDIRMSTTEAKKTKDVKTDEPSKEDALNAEALKLVHSGEQQVLELEHISKEFPGVKALDNVSIKIQRGKVHAIMGENGAGKSTLMKVLTGVYSKDCLLYTSRCV